MKYSEAAINLMGCDVIIRYSYYGFVFFWGLVHWTHNLLAKWLDISTSDFLRKMRVEILHIDNSLKIIITLRPLTIILQIAYGYSGKLYLLWVHSQWRTHEIRFRRRNDRYNAIHFKIIKLSVNTVFHF